MRPSRVRRRTNRVPSCILIGSSVVFLLFFVIAIGSSWEKRQAGKVFRRVNERRGVQTGQVFRHVNDLPQAVLRRLDAVLVLGGGVPKSLEEPPIYVQRRCDDAAAIVLRHETTVQKGRLPILTLSAGTAHVPQLLSKDGLPIWESTSSAAYLKKAHGMDSNVYVETTSYDTIGNAYYARTGHTDVIGWRRLLIITNEVRMCNAVILAFHFTLLLMYCRLITHN